MALVFAACHASAAPAPQVTISSAPTALAAADIAALGFTGNGAYAIIARTPSQTGAMITLLRGTAHGATRVSFPAASLFSGSNWLSVVVYGDSALAHAEVNVQVNGGGLVASAARFTLSGHYTGPAITVSDGIDTLSTSSDFAFPTPLAQGSAYAVSVTRADGLSCTVGGSPGVIAGEDAVVTVTCAALSEAPRAFFTDLLVFPGVGGENGAGAFVTIYGLGFGTIAGIVTIGNEAAQVVSWRAASGPRALDSIVIQPGSRVAHLGVPQPLVVHHDGLASPPLQVTVTKTGIIRFATPASLSSSEAAAAPGDVVYLHAGTYGVDPSGCAATASICGATLSSGTAGAPLSFVGYPGESAVLGGGEYGARLDGRDGIVLAELAFTNATHSAVSVTGADMRLVALSASQCATNAAAYEPVIAIDGATRLTMLGLALSDNSSSGGASAVRIYNGSTIELGYSSVVRQHGDYAVQLLAQSAISAVSIHDSLIDTCLHGGVQTNGPSDSVSIVNTVIAHAGDEAGAQFHATGSTMLVHDTFYDNPTTALLITQGSVSANDSIFFAAAGAAYVSGSVALANDLFFAAGAPPAQAVAPQNGDPAFVDRDNGDFRLQAGSAAVDRAGVSAVVSDYLGIPRPQGVASDIGAFELTAPSSRRSP